MAVGINRKNARKLQLSISPVSVSSGSVHAKGRSVCEVIKVACKSIDRCNYYVNLIYCNRV